MAARQGQGTGKAGAPPPAGANGPSAGLFVGRARELDSAGVCLDGALAGRGAALLIAGEAGMGKTCLAEQVAERARTLGAVVAWGRCAEEEGAPPFWPWRPVLRSCLAGPAGKELLAGIGAAAADLAGIVPDLARPHGTGGTGPVAIPAGGEERFRLFETVTAVLAAAAARSGLVVVIDDLHWADRSSALLLAHLGRDLSGSRILVVAAYRDLEITGGGPAAIALAALSRERGTVQVQLTGLAEVDVADQLEATCGRRFDMDVIAGVARRSHGNPFFVAEIGRLLDQAVRAGQLDRGHWEQVVPVGVRALITRRLDRLTPDAREFLRTAAVAGAAIDAAAVAAACALTPEQVLDQLDAGAEAGLISAGPGMTEFSHALVRDTLAAEVSSSRRVRIHRRIAEHIEAAHAGEADRRAASLAHHWLSALPAADARHAVGWAERAAASAMAALAYEEAARLYERGLAAMEYGRFDSQDRCRLLTGRAEAAFKSGDVNSAIASASSAAREARRTGDPLVMAGVAVCLEGVTDTAWARTVVRISEEALGRLADDQPEPRARLVAALAAQYSILDGPARAGPLSEQAMELAERAGTPGAQVSALRARQMARADPDGVYDRLDAAERMLVLAGRTDDPWAEVWGRLWRIDANCQLGELDVAEADLAGLGDVTGVLRQPVADWHLARTRCAIALGRGRFADAGCHLEQMARAGRGLDARARQMQAGAGSKLAALTGDPRYEPFVAMLEARGDAIQASAMMADINLALLYASRGDMGRAAAHYNRLGPWRIFQVPHFVALAACNERARAAALLGDVDGAAIAYRRLRPWARYFAAGGSGVVTLAGSAELALGCLAATMGKTDLAIGHLRAAIGANHRAGMPPFEADARFELAKVLASRPGRDNSEALILAADAAGAAGRLGMEPLRAKAQDLAGSLRQPSGGSGPAGLTRREQEIAGLVARGLTNRQIAEALHISERTAENHVQHILAKLGFQTRSQIAAWATAEDARAAKPRLPPAEEVGHPLGEERGDLDHVDLLAVRCSRAPEWVPGGRRGWRAAARPGRR